MPKKFRNLSDRLTMIVVVALVGVGGTLYLVATNAQTSYANPYSCSTHPVLSTGSTGTCVKYLQYVLAHTSTSPGLAVDGSYGSGTKTAVQKYQFANKISNSSCGSTYTSCDGVVGSSTWSSIDSYNAAQTKAAQPAPTGSLSCGAAATDRTTIGITYNNPSSSTTFYRGSTLLATFNAGSASFNRADVNLAAGTTYYYSLKSGSTTLATRACATNAAPAPAPSPPPATSSSPSPPPTTTSSSPSSTPTTTTTSSSPSTTSPQTTTSSTAPTGTSSGTTTVVSSGSSSNRTRLTTPSTGTTSTSQTPINVEQPALTNLDEYATTADGSSASDSPSGNTTSAGSSFKPKLKTETRPSSVVKTAGITLLSLGLLAGAVVFVLARRRSIAGGPEVDNYYSFPEEKAVASAPLHMPISTPPLANNKIEQRINDAFYPAHAKAQAQTAAGQPSTPSDEPPDMFELANSRPETFGNLHYNDLPAPQLAPAAPLQPLEQLEPIVPPDPVEPAALTPTESSPSAPHKPVPESNELKIEHD